MEDPEYAKGVQQISLLKPADEVEVRTLQVFDQQHQKSDVATSQVQRFPTVQPSQHSIDDEGQQPGQQTHSIRTLQGPSPHGEAFQETPDVKPHLLVDDGNEQDPDVGAFQLHPVVWPLQGQQNLSPPLALAKHNPSSHNAAVLQNPALTPEVVQNSVTDTGTDWCREIVVTQNKRQPSATNSTAQTTGSDGTITVTDRGVLQLWRTIGEWKKLATDSDIARFLLSLYFNPKLAETQSDSRCVHCSTPLTMCCITCLLSAKQPAPSQSSSSGKSHLSQRSSCIQGRHGESQDSPSSEDEKEADSLCGNDSEDDAEDCVSNVEIHKDTSWERQARNQWNMTTTPVVLLRKCDFMCTSKQLKDLNKKTTVSACRRGPRSSAIPQEEFAVETSPNQRKTRLEKDCAVAANKKRALEGRNVRNARLEAEPVPKKTRRQSVESLRHRGSARPGGETEDIASSDPLKGDLGSANSTASLKNETESHSTGSKGSVGKQAEREKLPICDGKLYKNGIPAFKHFSEYQCSRCNETFQYKQLIRRHLQKPYCDTDDAAASCMQSNGSVRKYAKRKKLPICDGTLYKNGDIPAFKHFSEYRCSRCNKTFQYRRSFMRHMPNCDTGDAATIGARPGDETEDIASSDPLDGSANSTVQNETESHIAESNGSLPLTEQTERKKEEESDDDWAPSDQPVDCKEEGQKSALTKKRTKKRNFIQFDKEYTVDDFMTGKVQIPIGVHYTGFSRKRSYKAYSHYTCEQCCKVLTTKRAYNYHTKDHLKAKENHASPSHTEPEPTGPDPESLRILTEIKEHLLHCCPHCNRIFVNSAQLRVHLRSHAENHPTCLFCGASFRTRKLLRRHQKLTKVPEEKKSCKPCGLQFEARCQIFRHVNAHRENEKKNCKVCGESFDGLTKLEINRHLKTHKELQDQMISLCTVCGKSISSKVLSTHMKTHSDPNTKPIISCSVCNQIFKSKSALYGHRKTHGEKKFQCETCGEYFYRARALEIHRAYRHLGQAFECKECGKQLSTKPGLEHHVRNVHRKVRPYCCSVCGHGHTTPSDLNVHMRMHTGEKPYQCPHCPSKFARSDYLKFHVRTHTGERPYGCEDCGQRFISRSGLTLHRRNRHSDKIFPCSECEETFPLQSSLDFHCYNEHGGNHPSLADQTPSAAADDVTKVLIAAAVKCDQIL